ncbi:transposase [Lactiplantibacillus plantarum]|uniref:transposase n=1 Tax=Lactiplantibacillus plantarum TaxID=1590 RepID=UPI003C1EDDAC
MATRYDKEFKQNIITLYKQGESAAQLAREYGIGYSTVHKWIQGQAKTQSGKSPDEIKAMENRHFLIGIFQHFTTVADMVTSWHK